MSRHHVGQLGIPVDALGGPTIDPTKNVLDLVAAAIKRQDDLRDADMERVEGNLQAFQEHLHDLMESLDKRYEQRFQAQKEASAAELEAQERAVAKAEMAAEKRFESLDRARVEQADQQRMLIPRAEVSVLMHGIGEKIASLAKVVEVLDNQQRPLIPRSEVDVLIHSVHEKIAALAKVLDESKDVVAALQAERQGVKGGWGYAVGVIGFLLAIGSLLMIGIRFMQQPVIP